MVLTPRGARCGMQRHRSAAQRSTRFRNDPSMRRPRVGVHREPLPHGSGGDTLTTKRNMTRWAGLLAASAILITACSSPGTTTAPSAAAPSAAASEPAASESAAASQATGGFEQFVPDQALLDAAKAEGTVTTIALPHDWCNYGESISTFKERTGLEVNELDPNAGSGDEVEAIKANQNNPGPSAPDVIDVGLS